MKKINRFSICISFLLVFCFISFLTSTDFKAFGQTFIKENEISISHLTDIHHFSLKNATNVKESDFQTDVKYSEKMLIESSDTFKSALKLVYENPSDVLLVTGDLTKDGERQGTIEVANALRKLQNDVRAKSTLYHNFQIFVINGNHDIYNERASRYDENGKRQTESSVTRKEFSQIYSGLGYPDLSNEEIKEFYTSEELKYYSFFPYEKDGETAYVESKTASNFNIKWEFDKSENDYEIGELSYIATNFSTDFIAIDEEMNNPIDNHILGGRITSNTKKFIIDNTTKSNKVSFMHHNLLPHFSYEDSLTKDFVLTDWELNADFLSDVGVRYNFSGHMHSNDIASKQTFNNNMITDIQTAATLGYMGGVRKSVIEFGRVNSKRAERFKSNIDILKSVDFSYIVENNLICKDYLGFYKLENLIIDGTCYDMSKYSKIRHSDNMIRIYARKYINFDFIKGALNFDLPPQFASVQAMMPKLLDGIFDEINDKILKDYQYNGTNLDIKNSAKIYGFIDDIVEKALSIKTADSTLEHFGLGLWTKYISGTDTTFSRTEKKYKEFFEEVKSGKIISRILDIMLDKNTGVYFIIDQLANTRLDVSKYLTPKEVSAINGVIKLCGGRTSAADSLDLNEIFPFIGGMAKINVNPTDDIMMYVDGILEGYLTESMVKGLSDIAHDILYSFGIDDSEDGVIDTAYVKFKEYNGYAYIDGMVMPENASIDNKKLPSMLTVTFGKDPTSDKNFTYFTDVRIDDGFITYSTDSNLKNSISQKGERLIYAKSYPSIDVGIFATLQTKELSRHTIELTNLTPSTTYYYKLGSKKHGYFTDIAKFTTAPGDDGKFDVLLISDAQGYTKTTYEKSDKILNNLGKAFDDGYDFVINSGDAVDNSNNTVHYEYMLNTSQKIWANTTQVMASGNHENNYFTPDKLYTPSTESVVSNEYNSMLSHYNIPLTKQDTKKGFYYSFDYSKVHFTVLNTNDTTNTGLGQEQMNWLLNDLKSTENIKVVVMHKSLYSAGSHNKDAEILAMRKQLTKIFAENNVAIVLAGHDHTYSESYLINKDGNINGIYTAGTPLGKNGVLYVTLGTIGDKFYKYVGNDNVAFGKEMHNPYLDQQTFGKLSFDGKNLTYEGFKCDKDSGSIKSVNDLNVLLVLGIVFGIGVLMGAIVLMFSKNR